MLPNVSTIVGGQAGVKTHPRAVTPAADARPATKVALKQIAALGMTGPSNQIG